MSQALLYGLIVSTPLVLGPLIGSRVKLPKHLVAVILAFAAGTFISALAFDLFSEAFNQGGLVLASIGFLTGAAGYILFNVVVARRKRSAAETGGLLLFAGAAIDGIPENIALGTTLATGEPSLALLMAIVISNFPEGLVSSEELREGGKSTMFTLGLWFITALLLVFFVPLGQLLGSLGGGYLPLIQSFAAGAVLGLIADGMLPQAYKQGGPWVAFSTAAGFLLAFMLTKL